jgi:hypothetical protein
MEDGLDSSDFFLDLLEDCSKVTANVSTEALG